MITSMAESSPTLRAVLASAARLQEVVPDAVLVGGSAAVLHAGRRDSFDHDHELADLVERYEDVLEAVEATDGQSVVAPTADEALRVKAYLVVQRNAVRDHLDVRWHKWADVVGACRELALRLGGAA